MRFYNKCRKAWHSLGAHAEGGWSSQWTEEICPFNLGHIALLCGTLVYHLHSSLIRAVAQELTLNLVCRRKSSEQDLIVFLGGSLSGGVVCLGVTLEAFSDSVS